MHFVFLLHNLSRELYCDSRTGGPQRSGSSPQEPAPSLDAVNRRRLYFEIRLQTFPFDKLVSATNHSFILLSDLIRCTEQLCFLYLPKQTLSEPGSVTG